MHPLEDATDLLIVLLYSPGETGEFGEPVEGRTRLQKLMFLLQEGPGPKALVEDAKEYDYEPYKMGPYSRELTEVVEELQSAGIIRTKRLEYVLTDDTDPGPNVTGFETGETDTSRVESSRYSLTDFGREIGERLWDKLSDKEKKAFEEFKDFFNGLTLRQLLIYTYDRFPEYTTESTIKKQLGLTS